MSEQICRNCANYCLRCMTCYNDHEYHDLNDSCKEYESEINEIEGEIEAKNDYKPKFTPGPWKAGKNACMTTILDGHEGKAVYPKESSYHIAWANAENEDGEIDMQTALANAALIAAAPELYEALEKIMEIELAIAQEHRVQAEDSEIYCIAEEAVRKARGESEVSE